MNLDAIKNKLQSLQSKGKGKGEKKEKVDMSKYVWKPKAEGKYQIRFVPSKFDSENPFKEVFLHYGISQYPIYALTNWGEKDPIVEFTKKLREGDFDKEKWQLANKLSPKMRVFAPIIVRGEEDKGVRLWEFGKETYTQLLGIAEDEDYGDYTDVSEGRDFTLTAVKGEVGGRQGVLKSTIQIKPNKTVLSKDAKQVEQWLEEQPDILEIQSQWKKPFDKLKEILAKFLTPEEETEEEVEEEVEETEEVTNNSNDLPWEDQKIQKSSDKPKTVKSKADKFDDLFKD